MFASKRIERRRSFSGSRGKTAIVAFTSLGKWPSQFVIGRECQLGVISGYSIQSARAIKLEFLGDQTLCRLEAACLPRSVTTS